MPRPRVPAPPIPDHVPFPTLSPGEAVIPLYRNAGRSRKRPLYALAAYSLVDQADYDHFSHLRWLARWNPGTRSYYAYRTELVGGKTINIFLHREILRLPRNPGRGRGETVDHENHDTIDNRRCNLRVANHGQQMANQRRRTIASQPYRGVRPDWGSYQVRICHNLQPVHVANTANEVEAAWIYNYAAHLLRGEFAQLNDIPLADLPSHERQEQLKTQVESKLRAKGLIP